jgi:hypothetical protein
MERQCCFAKPLGLELLLCWALQASFCGRCCSASMRGCQEGMQGAVSLLVDAALGAAGLLLSVWPSGAACACVISLMRWLRGLLRGTAGGNHAGCSCAGAMKWQLQAPTSQHRQERQQNCYSSPHHPKNLRTHTTSLGKFAVWTWKPGGAGHCHTGRCAPERVPCACERFLRISPAPLM